MSANILVLVSLCLVVASSSVARAEDPPAFLLKWGVRGSGDGEFDGPVGVAVDSTGNVYVTDYENSRVQKFTSDGVFVTKWGTPGRGDGQLLYPRGIAVDGRGVVHVAEFGNRRVQRFTSDGVFLGYLVIWDFQWPLGVAVDGSDNLYVTSPDGHGVFKFANNGALLTSWGTQGTGDGQFEFAAGIGVDASGYVFVSDITNNNFQKFTSDGVFVDRWSDAAFPEPSAVAVDQSGHVYVTTSHHRVVKFTSDGVMSTFWGGSGAGNGDGEFLYPTGIAAAGSFVYVADGGNHRIQKFGYPVSVQARPWGQVKSVYR